MDHLPQPDHPKTAMPGKKRLGRRLVGGLPRTNVHHTNVAAIEKHANSPAAPTHESRYRARRLAELPRSGYERIGS